MTEIRIAITPETLALLEMSMTEGDTYDAVIMRLMKTPWTKTKDGWECEKRWVQRTKGMDFTVTLPEGLSIDPGAITSLNVRDEKQELRNAKAYDLLLAARAVRDDIARTVHIGALYVEDRSIFEPKYSAQAISAIMKTENILALDSAVKAVFDE